MTRLLSLFTAAAALVALAASDGRASSIVVSAADPWVLTPSNAAATVLTFGDLPVGSLTNYQFAGGTLTGSGAIENTSVVGKFAQPAGTTGNYLTVSYPEAGGAVVLAFVDPQNYFGLYWGSIDGYNSISFINDGDSFASYTGTDIAGLIGLMANGGQQSMFANRYVNFYTGASFFNSVVLSTSNFGFEIASIAFGDPPPQEVPEPSTLLLLATFLPGLALVRRHATRHRPAGRGPRRPA